MKRYFLLLTMFLAVVACVEPENNQNNPEDPHPGDNYTPDITKYGEFKLADGVIFIDDMMDDFVTLDNSSVVISNIGATTKASAELSCFPDNLVPKEGDVIFIPLTDKFPEGFMGRVVSSEGKGKELHLETEEVSLLDVFAELNVKIENFDVGALVEEVEDNDGNVYSTETADSDVWDNVGNKEDQEATENVTTKAGGKDRVPKKISVKTKEFEGYLFAEMGVDIDLNIGLGKITYTVTNDQKIGLHLGADFKLVEAECELPILKAKPIPIPFGNLLAFKPQLVISSGFTLSGDVSLKAGLDILAVNESTTISNATGQVTRKTEQIGKVPSFKWNVDFIEMDLRFGIYFASAIEYTTVVKDMFAVGVEARASFETATNVVVSSSDESLLETNQTINFEPSLSISAYAKWRKPFLKEPEVFKSAPLIKTGTPISVNLLPPFTNLKKTQAKDAIAITGSIKPQSYVSSREQGYVLFKKGDSTPIEYKPCNENPNPVTPVTSAPAEEPKPIETEVKFTGLAKPEEYEVKAYVVAEDGKYYYKPIPSLLISKLEWENRVRQDLSYDGSGQLTLIHQDNNGFDGLGNPAGGYNYSINLSAGIIIYNSLNAADPYTASINVTINQDGLISTIKGDGYLISTEYEEDKLISLSYNGGDDVNYTHTNVNMSYIKNSISEIVIDKESSGDIDGDGKVDNVYNTRETIKFDASSAFQENFNRQFDCLALLHIFDCLPDMELWRALSSCGYFGKYSDALFYKASWTKSSNEEAIKTDGYALKSTWNADGYIVESTWSWEGDVYNEGFVRYSYMQQQVEP